MRCELLIVIPSASGIRISSRRNLRMVTSVFPSRISLYVAPLVFIIKLSLIDLVLRSTISVCCLWMVVSARSKRPVRVLLAEINCSVVSFNLAISIPSFSIWSSMAETWLWTSFILETSRCMILSMFHNIGCTPSGGDLGKSHPSLKFCSMASSSDVPSGLSSINERLRAGRLVASGVAASDPAGINLSDCPDDPFSAWDMVGWTQAPMTSNIFQAMTDMKVLI